MLSGCGGGGSTTTVTTTSTWAHSGELKGAPPGEFETYVLALEFQPQWSQTSCTSLVSEKLNSSVYARTQLSVHGMWPNYERTKHDGYEYPTWCGSFQECDPAFEAEQCKLDPAQIDAFNTSDHWQKYSLEYAWGTLAEHEWAKHGSCVGNVTQEYYFGKVQEFVYALATTGGPSTIIGNNVGANVSYEFLQAEISEGGYVALLCSNCRLTDAYYLIGTARDAAGFLMPNISDFLNYPSRPAPENDCQLCTSGIHITNWTAEGCHDTEAFSVAV